MDAITIQDIAGYATEQSVWKLIGSLIDAAKSFDLCRLLPKDITLDGEAFRITSPSRSDGFLPFEAPEHATGKGGEAANVWAIGAIAFYTLMGVGLFEEKGGKVQSEETNIPRIGQAHGSQRLSDTIYQCLSYRPEQRITLNDLQSEANQALSSPPLPPKRVMHPSGGTYKTSPVKFWPEEMCGLLLVLLFMIPGLVVGQEPTKVPDELSAIVRRCVQLRLQTNTDKVAREFAYDHAWTLMDELPVDKAGECTLKNRVDTFGLNEMGFRLAKSHSGVTNARSRFRNGQDPRYNYSFIEVTAKKGCAVSYDITRRQGRQVFVVVPYSPNANFRLTMSRNGKSVGRIEKDSNGAAYLFIDEAVEKDDTLHLTIQNNSGRNQAFVIINYNSRQ